MKSYKVITILIATVAVVALVAGCAKKTTTPTVTTQEAQVKTGNVTNTVTATGNLVYSDQEDLSFGINGTVGKINVGVGDAVKKGDVLAGLDDTAALTVQ